PDLALSQLCEVGEHDALAILEGEVARCELRCGRRRLWWRRRVLIRRLGDQGPIESDCERDSGGPERCHAGLLRCHDTRAATNIGRPGPLLPALRASASMPRMRLAQKRTLLLLGACLFAFAAGETAVRMLLADPQGMTILAPNGERIPGSEIAHFAAHMEEYERSVTRDMQQPHGRLMPSLHLLYQYPDARWAHFDSNHCVTVDINSLGFRDDEFAVDKQLGELRILAIGDSFTHGHGVQLADSWPQVLERELGRTHRGPVQVINCGFATGFHCPDGYDSWLASDGLRLHPDVVIVGPCLNDLHVEVPMFSLPVAPRQRLLGSVMLGQVARALEQERLMREHRAHPPDYAQIVRDKPQQ